MSPPLPAVEMIEGLHARYLVSSMTSSRLRVADHYLVIGRIGDQPFFLSYDRGVTRWQSAADLDERLRRKILHVLRKELRHAPVCPGWCRFLDLQGLPGLQAKQALGDAISSFARDRWRSAILGDRDEDYVDLAVPFAEKDQAKASGAVWSPSRKVWRVNLALYDRASFERWLPSSDG